ncbi:ankyrin repeat domain-containing protein [Leptospira jelokensis]|uniref:Ankyrin repeat domain-containing protein n=1 Tax=Leptospira jelokensis TaxID=2484931 RepID=A0A4Z1A361_9LEPT|nr:ankyrin repeat domain-containing protein [Leptospira jelokensis]TGM02152.1 ankyrin repeat domain-containing protein [Leptospira jelokensis]
MLPFVSSRFFKKLIPFVIIFLTTLMGFGCAEDETVVKTPPSLELRLFQAVDKADLEMVKSLLAQGVSVNAKDSLGNSSLIKAVDEEEIELTKFLLQKGANVNLRNTMGETALYRAVYRGNLELVKLLVKAGAETKAKTVGGVSISDLAEERGEDGILRYLNSL